MSYFRSYKEHINEIFKNPEETSAYLESCLEEAIETREFGIFFLAVRHVVEARGGFSSISEKMDVDRESLYKSLTEESEPLFSTIMLALNTCGFEIGIHPVH